MRKKNTSSPGPQKTDCPPWDPNGGRPTESPNWDSEGGRPITPVPLEVMWEDLGNGPSQEEIEAVTNFPPPKSLLEIDQELRAADRLVAEVALQLVKDTICRCTPPWTSRGRHDPHGCTYEDLKELREACSVYDGIK